MKMTFKNNGGADEKAEQAVEVVSILKRLVTP
jgi:hypothetical protein